MEKQIKKPDVLIIGAGPAGLTAGIYAARLKLDTLILEDELVGGQIRDASLIQNYPGFKPSYFNSSVRCFTSRQKKSRRII